MTDFERKEVIINLLTKQGKVFVNDLSGLLDVSTITIRRDLAQLELEGFVSRFHGGAASKKSKSGFPVKNQRFLAQKKAIGEKATEYVVDGDQIFMDCGSTVLQMTKFLRQKEEVRVITNSLPVLLELEQFSNMEINLVGGEYDKHRRAIHGTVAVRHLSNYHVDKAFIGVDGISLVDGLSSHSEVEMTNSQAMASNAKQTIVLCDSSKLEKNARVKTLAWNQVDLIITDSKISPALQTKYRDHGIELVVAD